MADTQHFCLRWNNYQSSITSAFENLRDDEDFVDVTLACDGRSLKAHRVVLSACSPYFRELLKSTPCKHPVIVLQDVSYNDLAALVEFIYHGEVNVHHRSLSSFLKTAEVLRVSGLTQAQAEDTHNLAHIQSLANTGVRTPINPHQSYVDKVVDDSLFHQGASPPPHLSHSTPNGNTVNQLLRRAAAVAAMRRERLNSTQSDEPSLKMHRTNDNGVPANNNSPDVISHMPQITPTDFSTIKHINNNNTPPIKDAERHHINNDNHPSGITSNINNNNNTHGTNGNGLSGSFTDKDSLTPSPPSSNRLNDDVKSEPMDMVCGSNNNLASDDHSNDSVGEDPKYMGIGNDGKGSLSIRRFSSNNEDDIDNSIHSHTAPQFMMSPADSKMFSPTGSFNFSMAALADPATLAGLNSQFQSSPDLAGSPQETEGPTQRGNHNHGDGMDDNAWTTKTTTTTAKDLMAALPATTIRPVRIDELTTNLNHTMPTTSTTTTTNNNNALDNDHHFQDQPSTSITILVSPAHFDHHDDNENDLVPSNDALMLLGGGGDGGVDEENLLEEVSYPIRQEFERFRRRLSAAADGGQSRRRRQPSATAQVVASASKVCPVCNKTFSRAWSLQRHMTDRHFYVPQHLACDICGRTYRSRNSLISHKSQYHGAGISSKIIGGGGGGGVGNGGGGGAAVNANDGGRAARLTNHHTID